MEATALDESAALSSSDAEPIIETKSGPLLLSLVIPIGISSELAPEKTLSTPRVFAAVSDNSTIIASTRTCALLISSFEIKFLILLILF